MDSWLVKIFPAVHGTLEVRYRIHNDQPLEHIWSQLSPVYIPNLYFRLNIILLFATVSTLVS
jgi:hypothetical protein